MSTSASGLRRPATWRTLRFRLAAWNAVIIILTALVTLIGVRQGVRRALLSELDQVLADDLREVISTIQDSGGASLTPIQEHLTRMAESHEHHGWYVKLFDANGARIWASPDARSDRPRLPLSVRVVPKSFDGYRILDARMQRPVGGIDFVRVGATLRFIDRDLARIDRLVLLAAGAVLITAPPCGYWLAARATRPVGEIIQTAARLRPSHLDERLLIRGTDDELDRLAHTINTLLDRIAAYIDTKRDFLANAAHELRTPLAAIRSSVEVAMDGNPSMADYEELLVDLIEECTSLETLVNQLLLLVETESELPAAKFEPVDFPELAAKSVDMFTGIAEARGIELRFDTAAEAKVLGNRQHLRQVLNNLLDNAVKYADANGQIGVSLSRDLAARQVVLQIANSGPPLSTDELLHIFERFYRAESARTRGAMSGTGLGLSICQSIVHSHGGTIDCVSDGNGTTFSVRLPSLD